MTIKKKLLIITIVLSVLTVIMVFLPDSVKNRFLRSSSIDNTWPPPTTQAPQTTQAPPTTVVFTTPAISTTTLSNITQTTATSGVAVTSNGGTNVTASGVVWSTTVNPTITLTTKTVNGSGAITGLTAGTLYHVRAYATNSVGTSYGNDVTFTTANPPQSVCGGTIPDHAYQLTGYTGGVYTSWTYDSVNSGVHPSCAFTCNAGYTYDSTTRLCKNATITTYAITYSANEATSGVIPEAQTKIHSTPITLANNSGILAKTGYDFTGWNTAADGSGTSYAVGANYTANAPVTLYAMWTVKTYIVTWHGSNNYWSGSGTVNPTSRTVEHGNTTTFTVTPNNNYTAVLSLVTNCGGSLSDTTYTTGAITADCTFGIGFNFNGVHISDIGPISGTTQVGQTLSAGIVSPSGAKVSYKWLRADTATNPDYYVPIDGAINNTYTLTTADLGKYIYVMVNAKDGDIGYATSAASSQVIAATDTTPPATPATAPIITGGTTNGLPTLSAKCTEAGSTITWYSGTIILTTATCPITGTSFPQDITKTLTSPLTNGTYNITFSEKDTATPPNESEKSPAVSLIVNIPVATPPTIMQVTSNKLDGSYHAGTIIPISVEFSEPVTVVGIPTLTLETGTNNTIVPYKERTTDRKTLIFEYTVAAGHTSNDLNYASINALILPGTTTLKDATTAINADLTLPTLTSTSSLGGSKALIIDTTAPAAPAAPVVPQQESITLSSIQTGTFVATESTMITHVICTTGQKVKIYSASSSTPVSVTDCPNNNLATLTLPLGSQQGYASYYAKVSDLAGNESNGSNAIIVFKQKTSDAPGMPDMTDASDLGTFNTDNITNNSKPQFQITCTSGNTVKLFENTVEISTAVPCSANTALVTPTQSLSEGAHEIVAKQITGTGIVSEASNKLTITIDTTAPAKPTSFTYSGVTQTSANLAWGDATDSGSGVTSYIIYRNNVEIGTSTRAYYADSVLTSNTTYSYTVKAQDKAGNFSVLSQSISILTPPQTTTGGEGGGSMTPVNGVCNPALKTFSTPTPSKDSLDDEKLCKTGTDGTVIFNGSKREWNYSCRGTSGGNTTTCTVPLSLNSAATCELKAVEEPLFDECSLTNTSHMFYFYKYLDCLGIAEKSYCTAAGCTQEAKRQELVYLADRLRGIPLDGDYECQSNHTDTERGVALWVCEAAEKAQVAGLISESNTKFRPLDTMTRAEAYSVLMKSICIHPETTSRNWQTEVAKSAKEYGFTSRTLSTFEPNRQILRQELYALTARLAEYRAENPDDCDPLPEELICE